MDQNNKSVLLFNNVSIHDKLNERVIFSDLTFSLNEKECLFILGHSDVERTSILHAILGLTKTAAGTISIFGYQHSKLNNHQLLELRRYIGYMYPQAGLLQDITLRENIELPLQFSSILSDAAICKKVDLLIEECGLQDTQSCKATEVDNYTRKRVLLARAVINEPKLLLLDEPTTYIEEKDQSSLKSLISRLLFNKDILPLTPTTIITTEDSDWATASNEQIIILEKGFISLYENSTNSTEDYT